VLRKRNESRIQSVAIALLRNVECTRLDWIKNDDTAYFSQAWVNKMPFFSDVFPRDEFLLLFWNLHFAHAEGQGKLKKEELIKKLNIFAVRDTLNFHRQKWKQIK
jgi:hypothetical protein